MSIREIRAKVPVSSYEEMDHYAREMGVPISVITEACISIALKTPEVEMVSAIREVEHLREVRKAKSKTVFNPYGKLG